MFRRNFNMIRLCDYILRAPFLLQNYITMTLGQSSPMVRKHCITVRLHTVDDVSRLHFGRVSTALLPRPTFDET